MCIYKKQKKRKKNRRILFSSLALIVNGKKTDGRAGTTATEERSEEGEGEGEENAIDFPLASEQTNERDRGREGEREQKKWRIECIEVVLTAANG